MLEDTTLATLTNLAVEFDTLRSVDQRAVVGFDIQGFADGVWLAQYVQGHGGWSEHDVPSQQDSLIPQRPAPPPDATLSPKKEPRTPDRGSVPTDQDPNRDSGNQTTLQGTPVRRFASAPALPNRSEIARAMRPLKRPTLSRTTKRLDVAATVDATVELLMAQPRGPSVLPLLPVLAPALAPRIDVALIYDGTASMAAWLPAARELAGVLRRHGAFGCVDCYTLPEQPIRLPKQGNSSSSQPIGAARSEEANHARSSAPATLHVGLPHGETGMLGERTVSVKRLIAPSSRRLILVFSDLVHPMWCQTEQQDTNSGHREGSMVNGLLPLAAWHPLLLLQALPRRMWQGTALEYDSRFLRLRAQRSGLLPRLVPQRRPNRYNKSLTIPILSLEYSDIAEWANLISGADSKPVIGYAFPLLPQARPAVEAAWHQKVPRAPSGLGQQEAEERVSLFIRLATGHAIRLAQVLAVQHGSITLDFMRRVMIALLGPRARTAYMAEILLRHVLTAVPLQQNHALADHAYTFSTHIRTALRDSSVYSDKDEQAIIQKAQHLKLMSYGGESVWYEVEQSPDKVVKLEKDTDAAGEPISERVLIAEIVALQKLVNSGITADSEGQLVAEQLSIRLEELVQQLARTASEYALQAETATQNAINYVSLEHVAQAQHHYDHATAVFSLSSVEADLPTELEPDAPETRRAITGIRNLLRDNGRVIEIQREHRSRVADLGQIKRHLEDALPYYEQTIAAYERGDYRTALDAADEAQAHVRQIRDRGNDQARESEQIRSHAERAIERLFARAMSIALKGDFAATQQALDELERVRLSLHGKTMPAVYWARTQSIAQRISEITRVAEVVESMTSRLPHSRWSDYERDFAEYVRLEAVAPDSEPLRQLHPKLINGSIRVFQREARDAIGRRDATTLQRMQQAIPVLQDHIARHSEPQIRLRQTNDLNDLASDIRDAMEDAD